MNRMAEQAVEPEHHERNAEHGHSEGHIGDEPGKGPGEREERPHDLGERMRLRSKTSPRFGRFAQSSSSPGESTDRSRSRASAWSVGSASR